MEISLQSEFQSVAAKIISGGYPKTFIQNSPEIQKICALTAASNITAYNILFDLVRQIAQLKAQHDADRLELFRAQTQAQQQVPEGIASANSQMQSQYSDLISKLNVCEQENMLVKSRCKDEIADLNRIIASQAKEIEELKFMNNSFKVQGNSIKQSLLDCQVPADMDNLTGAVSALAQSYLKNKETLEKSQGQERDSMAYLQQHLSDQQQIEGLKSEIILKNSEILEYQKKQTDLNCSVASLTQSCAQYQESARAQSKENSELRERVNQMETKIADSEKQCQSLQITIAENQKLHNTVVAQMQQQITTAQAERNMLKDQVESHQLRISQQAQEQKESVKQLEASLGEKIAAVDQLQQEVASKTAQIVKLVEDNDVISGQLRRAAELIPPQFQKSNLVEEVQGIILAYNQEAAKQASVQYDNHKKEEIATMLNALTSDIIALQSKLSSDGEIYSNRMASIQSKMSVCEESFMRYKQASSEKASKQSALEADQSSQINAKSKQVEALQATVNTTSDQLTKANKKIIELTADVDRANAKVFAAETEKQSVVDEQEKLKKLNAVMSAQSAENAKRTQELQDTIRDLQGKLFNLNTESQNLQIDKRSAEERYNNQLVLLKSLNGSVEELRTQLENAQKQNGIAMGQKTALEKEKLQFTIRVNELEAQLKVATAEASSAKNMFSELNDKYQQLDTKYQCAIEQQKFSENQNNMQTISYQEYAKQFDAKIQSLEHQLKCQTEINATLQKQVQTQIDSITALTKAKRQRSSSSLNKSGTRQKDAKTDQQDEKDQQISVLHEIVMNQKQLNEQLTEVLKQKQNDIDGLQFFINRLSNGKTTSGDVECGK